MHDATVVSPSTIGLVGAGAQAREIASYLAPQTELFWAASPEFHVPADPRTWVDVASPDQHQQAAPVVGAVGAPGLRRELLSIWPGSAYATVVAPGALVDDETQLGAGTVVAPGAVLSVNVATAQHCLINIGATLSHDVRLGAFVTVSPGVHVAGNVTIGDGAFLGIGSVVSHGVTLAPGVVVAAGAVVISDITEPNTVVVGVPAKPVKVRGDWLRDL